MNDQERDRKLFADLHYVAGIVAEIVSEGEEAFLTSGRRSERLWMEANRCLARIREVVGRLTSCCARC